MSDWRGHVWADEILMPGWKWNRTVKFALWHCSLTSYLSCTEPSQEEGLSKVSTKFHPVCFWVSAAAGGAFFTGFSRALFLCLVLNYWPLHSCSAKCLMLNVTVVWVHWLKSKCILHVFKSNATYHHQTLNKIISFLKCHFTKKPPQLQQQQVGDFNDPCVFS